MIEPKVVVLILSFNGRDLLKEAVSSYLNNDYANFKVVVVDNGSTDHTKQYVADAFPDAIVLRLEKNRGYSGGFNFGLDYAFKQLQADYVLITNNDVKADPNVISELVKVAESDERIGFVTGKVYYYDEPGVLQTVGKKLHPVLWNGGDIGNRELDEGQYDTIEERPFADDVFTLVRRALYQDVGGYDTTFFLQSEEYDWQARAKKHGYKIYYTPFAKIWHKDSVTIGKTSPQKAYYDSRNPTIVILKHQSPDFFRKYFWWHFKNRVCKQSVKLFLKMRFKTSCKIWQGFISSLSWGVANKRFNIRHFLRV